jgi:hypothetical protein
MRILRTIDNFLSSYTAFSRVVEFALKAEKAGITPEGLQSGAYEREIAQFRSIHATSRAKLGKVPLGPAALAYGLQHVRHREEIRGAARYLQDTFDQYLPTNPDKGSVANATRERRFNPKTKNPNQYRQPPSIAHRQ